MAESTQLPHQQPRPPERRAAAGRKKDQHGKVSTAKGPRDRRLRLAAHTAIQFYDVQDRLGFDRPSKAVDWLMEHAKPAIDNLAAADRRQSFAGAGAGAVQSLQEIQPLLWPVGGSPAPMDGQQSSHVFAQRGTLQSSFSPAPAMLLDGFFGRLRVVRPAARFHGMEEEQQHGGVSDEPPAASPISAETHLRRH